MLQAKIHIGTSGWSYQDWNCTFYPKGIKAHQQLSFYSQYFDNVEVNSSFYRLPTEKTIRTWSEQVPKHFIFSIKASRFITHTKRLKDYELTTNRLFDKIEALGQALGPILFQLPSNFHKDFERLEAFLKHLPRHFHYTFEFRHPSWFDGEIYELLKKYGIALCITDLKGHLSPEEITTSFTYIRLHGPKLAYRGSYGLKRLEKWSKKMREWLENNIEVYCYFDNTDVEGRAVKDAKALKELMTLPNLPYT